MKNEEILKVVDDRFKDTKDLIDAKFTHLSAIIQDGFYNASSERTTIIEHQKVTNGRVNKLEDNAVVFNKHISDSNGLKKFYKWIAIGFVLLVFSSSLLAHWLIENVDARKTFENKTGIELIK